MHDTGFSPWPSYSPEEVEAVARVLASNRVNYWTGTECREFEAEFARWCGCEHAVALANGTVALELALQALGIGPGDEVVVTPRSFIASVCCVVHGGAMPVFADVDRDTAEYHGRDHRAGADAAHPRHHRVHLAGWPCDMDPIMALAARAWPAR